MKEYQDDIFDGRHVPPLVVDEDYALGNHDGSVHVEAGSFTLTGVLRGSLDVQPGAEVAIQGTLQGSVTVAHAATVVVTGAIEGSTLVASGASVTVEAGAKLAGSLSNDGLVIIRGVFGGARNGAGELRLEANGYIRQPRMVNGIHVYEW